MLEFSDHLTSHPGSISSRDLENLAQHLNEKQIVELIMIIAVANFTNRINDGAMTPIDV